MNAQSPHVDIDELIAEPVSELTKAHLASCPDCRAEARRWESAAGGVRKLMTATVAPPGYAVEPDWTVDDTGARRKPRRALYAAAAAAVLLGGMSYGLAAAQGGQARSGAAVLTAVSGCAGLVQADGTLAQVNGTNVVITTASGQPVTATTSASTRTNVSNAPLSDIADGDYAAVAGPQADGTTGARIVLLGTTPPWSGGGRINTPYGTPVEGTVADADATGFTLVTSDGTQIPVTTSSDTNVTLFNASLSQLHIGAYTIAVGYPGPDGTLAANAVLQPPSRNVTLTIRGCTPGSIGDAITTALTRAG